MATRERALQEGVMQYNEASSSFECTVCRSPLTGEASVDQHLDGSKHREAGVRYAIANINTCPSSLKSLLTSNCITAVENGVICATDGHALRCTVCSVALTGIRQIEAHLIGEDHRKKCERQRLSSAPLPAVTPERRQVVQLPVGATANLGQLPRQLEPHAATLARSVQSPRVVEPASYVSQPPLYVPPGEEMYATYGGHVPYVPGTALPVSAPRAEDYGLRAEQFGPSYPAAAAPTGRDTSLVLPQPNRCGASLPNRCGASLPNRCGASLPNRCGASQPNRCGASLPNRCGASPSPAAPPSTLQPLAEQDENMRMIEKAIADGLVIETDNVSELYHCNICSKKFNSPATLYDHLRSSKHKKKEHEKSQRWMSSSSSSDVSSCLLSLDETSSAGGRDPYSVTSEPRGHVYVFNNRFQGQGSDWQRNGAEIDSQNLNETFTRMGYKVFLYEDLTEEQTEKAFKEIRQNPDLNGIDVFILFILSHGKDPYTFYTNDQNEQDLFYVRSLFTNRNCPYLSGKPKIIFTNYCRGNQMERKDVDAVRDVPKHMITIHAVSEGIMAKRHQRRGTYFIFCLCKVLRGFAHQYDLHDLYAELYEEMAKEGGTRPMTENHGFVKKFYFNPYQ